MSRWIRRSGTAAAVLLLQGCMSIYAPAPGEQMATLRVVGFGAPQMCKDGKLYHLPPAKDVPGALGVPAGQRLTLGAYLSSEGYQVIHYCHPFLSFVPRAGQSYVLNSALSGTGRCFIEVVRQDAFSATGLSVEPSVAGPACATR
jgi:hypothetical protein